jgi:hypothetical protein
MEFRSFAGEGKNYFSIDIFGHKSHILLRDETAIVC